MTVHGSEEQAMTACLILADSAQAFGGKVDMIGAGWYVTQSPTPTSALVGLINVPASSAREALPLSVVLLDPHGQPVVLGTGDDAKLMSMQFNTTLDLSAAASAMPGLAVRASFAITVPEMPLPPGRYLWSASLGECTFSTDFVVVNA